MQIDELHPEAIGKMLLIADTLKVDLVCCNIIRKFDKFTDHILLKHNRPNKVLSTESTIDSILAMPTNIVAKLIRSNCIKSVPFDNPDFTQDWNISYKLFPNIKSWYFLNEGLYYYWLRENSQSIYSISFNIQSANSVLSSLEGIINYYEDIGLKWKMNTELSIIAFLFFNVIVTRGTITKNFKIEKDIYMQCKKVLKQYRFNFPMKTLAKKPSLILVWLKFKSLMISHLINRLSFIANNPILKK